MVVFIAKDLHPEIVIKNFGFRSVLQNIEPRYTFFWKRCKIFLCKFASKETLAFTVQYRHQTLQLWWEKDSGKIYQDSVFLWSHWVFIIFIDFFGLCCVHISVTKVQTKSWIQTEMYLICLLQILLLCLQISL